MLERNRDRALAALLGGAIGDALGMPTQSMEREDIARVYGRIDGFMDALPAQPISAGLKAGTITDDTEQTVLLARHLIERGGILDADVWARQLLDWEADTRVRNVNDLLGPSTKRAIAALQAGESPEHAGRFGTTNGAAMRIMPVAIASPAEPIDRLIDRVEETCRLTHNTSEAIGAASAVAALASAGLDGASFEDALPAALAACRLGEQRGAAPRGGRISDALVKALAQTREQGKSGDGEVACVVGSSVAAVQSVPAAFAIVRLAQGDPWRAAVLSANLGGDTDTIGAIACGMAAACTGIGGLPPHAIDTVARVNSLDFNEIVSGLLDIRMARSGRAAALEHQR